MRSLLTGPIHSRPWDPTILDRMDERGDCQNFQGLYEQITCFSGIDAGLKHPEINPQGIASIAFQVNVLFAPGYCGHKCNKNGYNKCN